MQIRVKLFAILRERAGIPELELELSAGATVADAVKALAERVPAIGEQTGSVAYAVNRTYAKSGRVLQDGDELAVIPPVSGG